MTTGAQHAVEVRGLERAAARRLSRMAPNDTTWTGMLAVHVDAEASDTAASRSAGAYRRPPVIGRYVAAEDWIRFEPRFPFAAGVAYRVDVDTAAIARLAVNGGRAGEERSSTVLTHRFALPTIEHKRTTRILAVHPSAAQIPSNVLRWYLEFSAPMEPGNALAHVRLVDEAGREIDGAFLALDQELWDPERRRLTLLLDPGRVKRGIRTNLESGAPLIAGRRYTLVIDDGWVDGTGAPLASGKEHAFEAIGDDRESPDPRRWRLTIPRADTRSALRVAFGEPLDHALASRMVAVHDASGRPVAGSVQLADGDRLWSFVPTAEWAPGDYTLRVDSALEDVAGNNVARAFDVDRRTGGAAAESADATTRSVPFKIAPAL